MKKDKKNKGRKSLTAVGAVVAAGLTPGIITGTPASLPPSSDVELTAADVVSINGEVFDFDELFAMARVSPDPQVHKTVYGPPKVYGPVPPKPKDKNRQQEIEDSIKSEKARIEAMRLDSIRRAQEEHKLVYGPPPPRFVSSGPEDLRAAIASNKEEAWVLVKDALKDFYFRRLDREDVKFSLESHLIRDLKMDSQQLEELSQEIDDRFGVQVTEEMINQLGSLERIIDFIIAVATPIKE